MGEKEEGRQGKGEEGSGVQGDKGGEEGPRGRLEGSKARAGRREQRWGGGAAKSTLIHLQRPAEDLRSGSAQHPTGG